MMVEAVPLKFSYLCTKIWSVRTAGIPTEVLTVHLLNTSPEHYVYTSLLCYVSVGPQLCYWFHSSCLHRASIVSKTLFIIPTDVHNYKIIGMLKTIKVTTIAPTCFGSRRNHHQGAISCLAKTTIMILLCSSLMTWSMLWRHTNLLCKHAVCGRGRPSSTVFYIAIFKAIITFINEAWL
jgi:hypothetical protein